MSLMATSSRRHGKAGELSQTVLSCDGSIVSVCSHLWLPDICRFFAANSVLWRTFAAPGVMGSAIEKWQTEPSQAIMAKMLFSCAAFGAAGALRHIAHHSHVAKWCAYPGFFTTGRGLLNDAMSQAYRHGNSHCLEPLLLLKGNPNVVYAGMGSLLIDCAATGDLLACTTLLAYRADPDLVTFDTGRTALHEATAAAGQGGAMHYQIVTLLLNLGATVNAKDMTRKTPLDLALACANNAEGQCNSRNESLLVRHLKDFGAKTNAEMQMAFLRENRNRQ